MKRTRNTLFSLYWWLQGLRIPELRRKQLLPALGAVAAVAVAAYPVVIVAMPSGEPDRAEEHEHEHTPFVLSDESTAALEALLEDQTRPSEPGVAMAVFGNGRLLYSGYRGLANLDHQIELSEGAVFYAAELSKQVTAVAAAVLIDRGKLALDDAAAELLEDWPSWAEEVRVEHLLYHTAGLPDFIELIEVADLSIADPLRLEDYMEVVTTAGVLNHEAGSRFEFSRSNYLALAAVVEEVDGRSLPRFAEQELFEPLGMENSLLNDDRRTIIANRVIGYRPRRGPAAPAPGSEAGEFAVAHINTYQEYGAGGLYTTVEDWARWDRVYSANALELNDEVFEMLSSAGRTEGGGDIPYAFGLQLDRWNELEREGHDARFMGFRHDYRRFPEHGVSLLLLSNRDDIDAQELLERGSEIVLADRLEAWMRPYLGRFRSPELDTVYEFSAEGGRMYLERRRRQPQALSYDGEDRWRLGSWVFEFEGLKDERFTRLSLSTIRAFNVEFHRETDEAGGARAD